MKMNKIKILSELTKVELKLMIREFPAVFFILFFPSLMLILYGNLFSGKIGEFRIIDYYIPALIGLIIETSAIISIPVTISSYRERKILKRFHATPINPLYLLISQIISNFIFTFIGIIILIILGIFLFNIKIPENITLIIFSIIFSIISLFSLGFLIASFPLSANSTQALAWLIFFPMLFLSGATFPRFMFPELLKTISEILPLTYIINFLENVWFQGEIKFLDFLVISLVFIFCSISSIFKFKWEKNG